MTLFSASETRSPPNPTEQTAFVSRFRNSMSDRHEPALEFIRFRTFYPALEDRVYRAHMLQCRVLALLGIF